MLETELENEIKLVNYEVKVSLLKGGQNVLTQLQSGAT